MKNKIIIGSLIIIFLLMTFFILTNNSFILGIDDSIHNFIATHQFPTIYDFMLSITKIGDVFGTVVIFLVFGTFLFIKNKKS